jgi:hypothetical protein
MLLPTRVITLMSVARHIHHNLNTHYWPYASALQPQPRLTERLSSRLEKLPRRCRIARLE